MTPPADPSAERSERKQVIGIAVAALLLVGVGGVKVKGCYDGATKATDEARAKAVKRDMVLLCMPMVWFWKDMGRYPTRVDELVRLPSTPDASSWKGPYGVRGEDEADPWGRPYLLTPQPDGTFTLTSFGADGDPGGEGVDADQVFDWPEDMR